MLTWYIVNKGFEGPPISILQENGVNNLIRSLGGLYRKWNKIFYLLVNLMFDTIPYN
jgi:hypothetical protein